MTLIRLRNAGRKGFTLIELLIVIAIILILIAIALPNFLEAQIRAKAAKAKGEIRSLAIAMESYFLDWGIYPGEHERDQFNRPQQGFTWLTSPNAYIVSLPEDPFAGFSSETEGKSYITYESGGIENKGNPFSRDCGGICLVTWAIFSNGPDNIQSTDGADAHNNYERGGGGPGVVFTYSPTNGTKSFGEIIKYGGDGFWIGVNRTNGGDDIADKGDYNNSPPSGPQGMFVDNVFYLHTLPGGTL